MYRLELAVEMYIIFVIYCFVSPQGVHMSSLRFLFEGQRISDNHTPKEVRYIIGCQLCFLCMTCSPNMVI